MGVARESGGRFTHAFSLIETALQQAKLAREQVECIAIGLGPGSYTGIRIGVSIAQGWQMALGVQLMGLSSVECLVAQAQGEAMDGRVTFAIDAHRGEFYLATYDLTTGLSHIVDPLRLGSRDEVMSRISGGQTVAGPEVGHMFAGARTLFPEAATLVRLAATRNDSVSGDQLEPLYLRETAFVKAPPPRWFGSGEKSP